MTITVIDTSQHITPLTNKAMHWQHHINQWQSCRLTQSSYCEQHNLSLTTFGYWRTRLKKLSASHTSKAPKSIDFVPVTLSLPPPSTSLTLQTKQGLHIELCTGFDPALLKEVLQVLVIVQ
jgi:hypothetical protein